MRGQSPSKSELYTKAISKALLLIQGYVHRGQTRQTKGFTSLTIYFGALGNITQRLELNTIQSISSQ